ncbi:glycosyl transferase [Rhodospirillum rubrum]|uniref:glycosyltransferase n=1 Tax=Rhodospirillum rubrum TaxID=1085 RepID=UPI001903A1D4|nr:glycosyltransferase [Rhodospirillum rubrum]MBK1664396.1 glycosyl transferase [Rhodospirillum rubrum]MBK1677638.1 glycosyl transferase [Rhodospirillum rubrum]
MTAPSPAEAPPALITIGLTCYNAAATIERALDSALAQDWPLIEVVVVDDASSDGSADLLARRAAADGRIRLIRHVENQGCAAARNAILSAAKGAFIAFFDDDDVSAPQRLRRQRALILDYERESGAALVACHLSGQRIYANGHVMTFQAIGSRPRVPRGEEVSDYLLSFDRRPGVFYGGGTPTASLMARAEVFSAVGGFDVGLRRQEDVDFAVRLGRLGGHFIGPAESLLTQYASEGVDKAARVEHDSFQALLIKHRDYLVAKGRFHYMMGWSRVRFRHFNGQDGRAALALIGLFARYPLRTARHFALSASRRFQHERSIRA